MPGRIGMKLPDLGEVDTWVTRPPDALEGRPVLLHLWSLSCHLCSQLMPTVNRYRDTYGPQGLAVVGLHTPRSEEEMDVEKVRQAAQAYGLSHPVGVDNRFRVADRLQNRFVPSFYLFDREGTLRHYQAGEKGQEQLEAAIRRQVEAGGR